MRYIYRLVDFSVDNSQVNVSFRSHSSVLSFSVSASYLRRCINESLNGANLRYRRIRIYGVSFDISTDTLLSLKKLI